MRRKTRGMEKVENLYCTARAQYVMPQCMDHMDESGAASRLKPSRARPACFRARHLGGESTWAAKRRVPRHRPPAWWRGGMPGGPAAAMRKRSRRRRPLPAIAVLPARQPYPSLVRYESIRPPELCEYCADIAPIVPSLRNVP